MTVTIPTSEAQYGYVVGRVIRALGDSADPGDKPDAVAAVGKVTFTPKAPLGRTSDYSAFIVREKIDAPLDAQGNLVRYEGATPAGISLTVGAYRVEFTLTSGSIPSFDIEVTAGHTQAAPLDLVTAAPYVPPTGVTVQTMLVPADAVVGQVLAWSASGLEWVDMAGGGGGGAVSSVAGRTGAVVLSSADLTDVASLATDAELAAALSSKANAMHSHAPADIAGTAVITTDPRLSDARTPTTHTHTLADVTDYAAPDLSGYVTTTDPRLSDERDPTAHAHPISDVTGLQTALDGKAATGHTHAELHTHANKTALDAVSGVNTGDQDLSGLATTAELTAGLADKADAAHTHAELHTHANAAALALVSGTNTGDQDLSGLVPTSRTVAGKALTGDITLAAADLTDFTEASQDVVGAMVAAAGGTYDDAGGSITLPAGGGGGSSTQVDVYYAVGAPGSQSSYTWTKPAGAKKVEVFTVGAGGGGGSGRRGAAGTVRCGGGGGAAGQWAWKTYLADVLPPTVLVKVAKGGAGGAAVTADDTDGKPGGGGGGQIQMHTGFGIILYHNGGGLGGSASSGIGGGATGYGLITDPTPGGGSASTTGALGGAGGGDPRPACSTGGGAGGGITSGDVVSGGGAGGRSVPQGSNPPGGTAGNPGVTGYSWGNFASGGSGGGSSITGAGGKGGDGGFPGGGGGGGGASLNGFPSGAGGNGGDGIVIVTTYF